MANKNTVPWNKGLTKEDPRVEKNSSAKRGVPNEKTKLRHEEARKVRLGDDYELISKPEEWKLKCECCEEFIEYTLFKTFYKEMKKQRDGKRVIKCGSCRNIGKTASEQTKKKMSESAKNKKIDPEVVKRVGKEHSIRMKKHHAAMTREEKKELGKRILEGQWNKPQEQIESWIKKRSDKRKAEMERLGQLDKFVPSYNQTTIPFIEGVLNNKYKTKFIHAKSEKGEYRVYDKEFRKTYYADAYSPELNIWVEFDEYNKFDKDVLKEEHIIRENRIKSLLGCEIIRIKIDKENKILL